MKKLFKVTWRARLLGWWEKIFPPRQYAFNGMSTLVDKLTTPDQSQRKHHRDNGTVRVTFKCDRLMSDTEAQSVLDASRHNQKINLGVSTEDMQKRNKEHNDRFGPKERKIGE
ncbi:MAG: hypothetical protein ACW99U_20185 [Candidatus Thorarchaeota archaeon]|jgi:hypothetical protein